MAAPSETYVDPLIAADSSAGTIGDLQYAMDPAVDTCFNGLGYM